MLLPPQPATRLKTVLSTTQFFPAIPESSQHSTETRKFHAQEQSAMTRPKSSSQFTAMSQRITLDFCFSSGRIAAWTFSEVSPSLDAFFYWSCSPRRRPSDLGHSRPRKLLHSIFRVPPRRQHADQRRAPIPVKLTRISFLIFSRHEGEPSTGQIWGSSKKDMFALQLHGKK